MTSSRFAVPGTKPHLCNLGEAERNRTRLPAFTGTLVLKFGDGHVGGCDLVTSGAIRSRSAGLFVLSGAALRPFVMSWMFAMRLQARRAVNDDFCPSRPNARGASGGGLTIQVTRLR